MSTDKADLLHGTLDFIVLKTLHAMGPLHGYAIARRIEQISADQLESLWQDIRYAVRTLRRAPLFAVTVAATMGLGLGLLGSVFTILNA